MPFIVGASLFLRAFVGIKVGIIYEFYFLHYVNLSLSFWNKFLIILFLRLLAFFSKVSFLAIVIAFFVIFIRGFALHGVDFYGIWVSSSSYYGILIVKLFLEFL